MLAAFRPVFRRKATFGWFVVILWALMLRMDTAGVTSIVRCMGLHPSEYLNVLHFFHSTAFSVDSLCSTWHGVVIGSTQSVCIHKRPLFVVDGIKVGKAGKKMPGVKLLHQESQNNTKPEYIMGHYWGSVGRLVEGVGGHAYSVPLRFQIQDGLKRSPSEAASLIDKMGTLVADVLADTSGIVVGDAYFGSAHFLTTLRGVGLDFIGKAKSSTVGYHNPEQRKPGKRGRPRKRGEKVKLKTLFENPKTFLFATICVYGKVQTVRYHCIDLQWQGMPVRFVVTIMADGARGILMCTDRSIGPEDIIFAYALRQKIEVSYQSLVHTLCGFGYHFWMAAMPKMKWGGGNQYLHRAGEVFRGQVRRKVEAYERFVNICAIAQGILQVLALRFHEDVWERFPVWMRTLPKHGCPSEGVVRITLQHELHQDFLTNGDRTLVAKILRGKRRAASPDHPVKIAA